MSVEFKHAALDNGLTVAAEIDPHAHSAAIGFFVKTGARDEQSSIMGVSHFLEHMMFKGTDTRSAEDLDRQFDALGADHNAFTTSEMTAFYAHCLPEYLVRAEEIVSDMMRPALRAQDFDAEKHVILEEIAMYRDQPFWVLYERAMEVYYGHHPLSHRVLGTDETIEALSRDEMLNYFQRRYSADNTVVALSGRLEFDQIAERLDAHCGGWERTDVARTYPRVGFEPQEFTLRSPTAHQHYVLMASPGPPVADERRYAAAMLLQILGEGDGSRLYWALVETGLADEAQAQYEGRDGIGEFLVYASCATRNAEQVESIIRAEIQGLLASLTDDDLERVRNKIATAATLQGELPAGRMRRLGRLWTYLGEYRSLEMELERINAVTLDDLHELAKAYPLDRWVVGRLTPE
jgi:predicted Zn-dependent peptidase